MAIINVEGGRTSKKKDIPEIGSRRRADSDKTSKSATVRIRQTGDVGEKSV